MNNANNTTPAPAPVSEYLRTAILEGDQFECSCGELFSKVEHAKNCRKCWKYLDHACEEVFDLSPLLKGLPAVEVWTAAK